MKEIVHISLEAIDKAYNDGKIELNNYNEITTVIENLNTYLLNIYNLNKGVYGEVKFMMISFYDPKVEERGLGKEEEYEKFY